MSTDEERIERAARFLFEAHGDRAPFSHPPEDIHPRNLDAGGGIHVGYNSYDDDAAFNGVLKLAYLCPERGL